MKNIEKLQRLLRGLTSAVSRFPLTSLFLLAAAIVNAADINRSNAEYSKYLLTLIVGAFLGTVFQVVYERFLTNNLSRILLAIAAVLLTFTYYLIIMPAPTLSTEISIRTMVALFALLFAFVWVPVIKSEVSFNESFMVAFKAFFTSLFFSAVIFAGISIILAAINQLLFDVNEKSYAHTANIVFVLYASIYFLALIPVYPGKRDRLKDKEGLDQQMEIINKKANCPKFLEILISYIIIPLTAVFTVILIIYIVTNIGGRFWTDNLLEPMIISYSITVLLIYILASRLENQFALLFRKIFPKVLIPIVIFQTISSILKTGDTGITPDRYYVILYGIYAIAAGILLSFIPVRKNGIIAAMIIAFSVVSVVPPVDAFTVSRGNQTTLLRNILIKNAMLEGNNIRPNASISSEDKQKITQSLSYLNTMGYTDDIPWIPSGFDYYDYEDFYKTFGFQRDEYFNGEQRYTYLNLPQSTPINISGYDYFVSTSISIPDRNNPGKEIGVFDQLGKKYKLSKRIEDNQHYLVIKDEQNSEILVFSAREIFDRYKEYPTDKGLLLVEEATFTTESDLAALTVIVQNANINESEGMNYYNADLYVLVKIKD